MACGQEKAAFTGKRERLFTGMTAAPPLRGRDPIFSKPGPAGNRETGQASACGQFYNQNRFPRRHDPCRCGEDPFSSKQRIPEIPLRRFIQPAGGFWRGKNLFFRAEFLKTHVASQRERGAANQELPVGCGSRGRHRREKRGFYKLFLDCGGKDWYNETVIPSRRMYGPGPRSPKRRRHHGYL